jgi:hypothetical protein
LVESGLTYNTTFATIGKERLSTYINNNSSFKATLASKGYYDNNKLQNLNTIKDIEEICSLFNSSVALKFPGGADYSKVLNPIYLKT